MRNGRRESGFAMLLVFLLSACVAITLYMEIPRVAFEAERQHELLLIDRGNQFRRAIQVFVTDRTNNPTRRYPASIEELESFNNHRYLRRRYVDPMTGKDVWRLVHINGGILTDSVSTQQKGSKTASSTPDPADYISTQAGMDSGNGPSGGGGLNRALTKRPSDTAAASASTGGDPNAPPPGGVDASGLTIPPGASGATGAGRTAGGSGASGASAPTCNAYIGGCAAVDTTGQNGAGAGAGGSNGQGAGGGMGIPGGGAGGGGTGSGMNAQASSAATSMIQNLLTTPRPGGMPSNMPGATIGGGIAGVASKFESEGIMVINDRTAINEWEYIFDLTKWRPPPNPVGGTPGNQLQMMGNGQGNGQNPTNATTPGLTPGR